MSERLIYTPSEFGHGLRCYRCEHPFVEGEPYFGSPEGFVGSVLVVVLICGGCEFAEVRP